LEVCVFTRSTAGAKFTLTNCGTKTHYVDDVEVKHADEDENGKPTTVILNPTTPIDGPVKVKVKADSHASRFSSHNYLVVFSFKPTK
jgi:hypothetical protein